MARAVYEQRDFTDRRTGEIIKYDWYGVQADLNGEYMELPLKNLDSAEKIAWKMIASGADPSAKEVVSGSVQRGSQEEIDFLKHQKNTDKIDLHDDED